MSFSNSVTIISIIVTLISIIVAVYYGFQAKKLKKSKVSLDFEDISSACTDIADFLKGKKFQPDIVYTPGAKTGILAECISQKFTQTPLVAVGILVWNGTELSSYEIGDLDPISNHKWKIFIPSIVKINNIKKILIVDDISMSGDGLKAIVRCLISCGFNKENIKTATVVSSYVAKSSGKSPDYCWLETESGHFYFPWGKTK
ncbi:phosphoribosyltransferase family protein [bacterium]|nr:phosphoribosyltransferase family protein [bacterium]